MAAKRLQLLPAERFELAAAVRKGAAAIAEAWDVLTAIGARTGLDWEPRSDEAVCNIIDYLASSLDTPESVLLLRDDEVLSQFEDLGNWTEVEAAKTGGAA